MLFIPDILVSVKHLGATGNAPNLAWLVIQSTHPESLDLSRKKLIQPLCYCLTATSLRVVSSCIRV